MGMGLKGTRWRRPNDEVGLAYVINCELKKGINLTLDYQVINHPGYTRDRGPVSVLGIRI